MYTHKHIAQYNIHGISVSVPVWVHETEDSKIEQTIGS